MMATEKRHPLSAVSRRAPTYALAEPLFRVAESWDVPTLIRARYQDPAVRKAVLAIWYKVMHRVRAKHGVDTFTAVLEPALYTYVADLLTYQPLPDDKPEALEEPKRRIAGYVDAVRVSCQSFHLGGFRYFVIL